MRIGTARNIRRGPVQAQQDLAVSVGSVNVPDQLARNIARIQVRKNQHVRVPGNLALRQFARRDLGHQRRVHLQFAVEIRLDPFFMRLLLGQRRRRLHSAD